MSKKGFLWGLLLACMVIIGQQPAVGHEGRPLLVSISEQGSGNFYVSWSAPLTATRGNFPKITLTGCREGTGSNRFATASARSAAAAFICPDQLDNPEVFITYPLANPSLATLIQMNGINGEKHSWLLSPEVINFQVPKNIKSGEISLRYFWLGLDHILSGPDHLLFILCLIVIARKPARMFACITGFTLAHSITMVLIVFSVLTVPSLFVELMIVLSILLLARELLAKQKETLSWRFPALVSVFFGLLHGMGFASGLMEIGLPQTDIPLALLFFNIGVEAGQLGFVSIMVGLYFLFNISAKNYLGEKYSSKNPSALSLDAHPASGFSRGCINGCNNESGYISGQLIICDGGLII